MTVRGVGRLDGDEGFAEVFFDDVFVPDDRRARRGEQGWDVAMATTSSERGLTLRSPGRFIAAATGSSTWLERTRGRSRSGACATASPRRGSTPRRTARRRCADVTGIVEGRSPGAGSSLNKLFWSELDVRLHELALDLLGPVGRARARGLGRRSIAARG